MEPRSPFWTLELSRLLAALDASEGGLSAAEAGRRARRYGPNTPGRARAEGALREALRLLANPLVVILLVAAGISAGMGEAVDAAIIAAVIILSMVIDGVQSHRSVRAAEALRRSVSMRACVQRDGEWREIHAEDVVPGDVVRLVAGDLIPGDARLLEAKDLFLDQAALTGESLPVPKEVEAQAPAGTELSAAQGAVFAGTSVVSGTGRAVVVHTGAATVFGGIAAQLAEEPPPTEFERGMARFSLMILRIVVALVLFVFLALAFVQRQPIEAFMFAIALAVGLTPEFLPMIVTITLARGAIRMARRGVIVKQLRAIENFGSIDVLCTDKTGTLTEGAVSVVRWTDWRGDPRAETLALAVLNSRHESGIRGPLDEAILQAPAPAGGDAPDLGGPAWTKLDEVPFDFHRRRMSVVLARGDQRVMVMKGAPEAVLAACTAVEVAGGLRALDEAARREVEATFERLGAEGLRVLALARRDVVEAPPYEVDAERDLALVGFLAFADPPRADAREAVAALARDGIRVVMLTGDGEGVARRVAEAVGLQAGRIVLGRELDAMRDEALPRVVTEVDVFARLSPEQKHRVVRALMAGGAVVGYLGDGINDAPSLRAADVGISVDKAVDVAREAAPIILTRPDLRALHQGVLEGRRSFANVMKYVMMETSSNFGNMFSMAVAAAFLPFLPMLPTQILLNNLLYDLAQVVLPGDRVDREAVVRPRRWNVAFIQRFMLFLGPVSSLFDFMTFGVLLLVFQASAELFHTGWFLESILTQTLVIFVIRTAGSPFASRPSPALVATVLAVLGVALALPFSPLASLLGFVAPSPWLLGVIGGMTVGYLILAEVMKRVFYRYEATLTAESRPTVGPTA